MFARLLIALLTCVGVAAQYAGPFRDRGPETHPLSIGNGDVPTWDLDPELPFDCFSFARLEFRAWTNRRSWTWWTDFRDADLNMSFRLHSLTAIRAHPEGATFPIDDPRLFDYPFTFMSGVGGWELNNEEAAILRKYLLNGGFLFVDDFHGHQQWDNFYDNIKKVFPDRDPIDLTIEHPIFHFIFDLKEMYQVPNVQIGRSPTQTWEAADWKEPHYCAIYDDKQRMCVFIAHNNDLGDGWEEERNNPDYFRRHSEPKAYPIGINVIMWALTH